MLWTSKLTQYVGILKPHQNYRGYEIGDNLTCVLMTMYVHYCMVGYGVPISGV